MNTNTKKFVIPGPVGWIEFIIDRPNIVRGIALVAHPHPLFGGTMDNKVTYILARTLMQLNYLVYRPNFRGVGMSDGVHDNGIGEIDDLLSVIKHIRAQPGCALLPLVLAGFSFGTFVLSHVYKKLADDQQIERIVFVGTAVSFGKVEDVPGNTLIIHGEIDDTIPIQLVYNWARPQELPIVVIPGAEHFFHRKLHILKRIITDAWR
ncbi:MAG: alpha/beta hydrolase [Burkholderia sp.]|nr:alpha/beta hydrolase [Burkholderia sp.]